MKAWQLQEAKNKLSELIDTALKEGPQAITRRGVKTVIVLSVDEYARITHKEENLANFFQSSPMFGIELSVERSKETSRDIEL